MRRHAQSTTAQPSPRRRDVAGFTLPEIMFAILIASILFIPLTAWLLTAFNESAKEERLGSLTAETTAFTKLNRYLKNDVGVSRSGQPDAPADTDCKPLLTGAGGDAKVRLQLFSGRHSETMTTYVEVPGATPPDGGEPISRLVRRTCPVDPTNRVSGGPVQTNNEDEISDYLVPATVVGDDGSSRDVGAVNVECSKREQFLSSQSIPDDCGVVSFTASGAHHTETVRAARRVDPDPDPTAKRRPIPVMTCNPACPSTGKRAYTVAFDSSLSSHPAGIAGQHWKIAPEGNPGAPIFEDDAVATMYTFHELGRFTVTLTVFSNDDGSGSGANSASVSSTITVVNAAPIAVASPNPVTTYRKVAVPFTGEGSLDPDEADSAAPPTYTWDFGDGSGSNLLTPPPHQYLSLSPPGGFQASFTVTDADGASTTVNIAVIVKNHPPIPNITTNLPMGPCDVGNPSGPQCARANDFPVTVSFNALGDPPSSDPDGSITAYQWQIWAPLGTPPCLTAPAGQDKCTYLTTGAPTFNRLFTQNGRYTVTLEVTDNDGAKAATSVEVLVNKAPTAVIDPLDPLGGPPGGGGGDPETPKYVCVLNTKPGACGLDASRSSDIDGVIVAYSWNFGDGGTSTSVTPTHTWTDYGIYDITLTVTDDAGGQNTAHALVKVNRPPNPVINPSTLNVKRKVSFHFSGSGSNDPDAEPGIFLNDFKWDFGDGTTGTGGEIDHVYNTLGTYTIKLTVTDGDGLAASTTRTFNVTNNAPVPKITGITLTKKPGGTYYVINGPVPVDSGFRGDQSTDVDGTITNYRWQFGDGSPDQSGPNVAIPSKTYTAYANALTVRLTVTDNDGDSATQTIVVKINQLPTASFTYSPTNGAGGTAFATDPPLHVVFNGSASSDADGGVALWQWDFGGANEGASDTQPVMPNDFSVRGTFTITLTVSDIDGGTATSVRPGIVVIDQKPLPKINVTPATRFINTATGSGAFTFTSAGSSDPDGTIATYDWDFGDGSAHSNLADPPAHTYATWGTYTVKLTVTDNFGISNSVTTTVKTNKAPTAVIAGPDPLSAGRNINFTFSSVGTVDPDGTIASYDWDFGDGTAHGTGPSPVHRYQSIATFTVTLTVTDDNGYTASTTKQINTNNAPPVAKISIPGPTGAQVYCGGGGTNCVTTTNKWVWNGGSSTTVNVDGALAGNASFDQDDASAGAITNYAWDWGDGSPVTSSASPTASHTYATYGTWNLTLTVTDAGGATGTVIRKVMVNRPPVVSFTPDLPTKVLTVSPYTMDFDASATDDPEDDEATWPANRYSWQPQNGIFRTGKTLSYTYGGAGTFTVTLTVTDNDGGTATVTKTNLVRVNNLPTAVIASPNTSSRLNNVGPPFTFSFDAGVPPSGSRDSDGTITNFLWDFGDGTTSTSQSGTHSYSVAGTYTISLVVTDNDGQQSAPATATYKANAAPTAVLGPSVLDPKRNLPFTFDGTGSIDTDGTIPNVTGSGPTGGYTWTFPGANTVSLTNPSKPVVTYTTNGSKTATLMVTDNNGRQSAVASRTFTVADNVLPVARFTTTPNDPPKGQTNPFTVGVDGTTSSDADGSIVSWEWAFGDGSTATGPTATHNYTEFGSFTLSLTVTDNSGETNTVTKQVRNNIPPVVRVDTLPNPPVFNDTSGTVQFFAGGSSDPDGTIATYDWNFGDGTTGTGSTVTHDFSGGYGTFPVTVVVTDNEGGTTTVVVPVKLNQSPHAVATINPVDAKRNLPVTFDGTGSSDPDGTVVGWEWDFGDGSTSSGPVIDHTYGSLGTFTATLTVTDNNGATGTTTIDVTVGNQAPVADITVTPSYPVVDLNGKLTFNSDQSYDPDGTIVSYFWDFGDGTTSALPNPPQHTFSTGYGLYNVELTVTDNLGATSTDSVIVKVNQAPVARILPNPANPKRNIPFQFDGSTSSDADGTIVSYIWDFGDGTTSFLAKPTKTWAFKSPPSFNVSLTVIDDNGRATTANMTVNVANQAPTAAFSASPLTNAPPLAVTFDGTASSDPDGTVASYSWNFGDGTPAGSGPNPTHIYTAVGNWTVTLTVTDNDGGTGSLTKTQYIKTTTNVGPTARIQANPGDNMDAPIDITFSGLTSTDPDGTIVGYLWDFGDMSGTVSGPNPTHHYGPGYWHVTLTVTDNSGATNTTSYDFHTNGTPATPTGLYKIDSGWTYVDWGWNPVPGVQSYQIRELSNNIWPCDDDQYGVFTGWQTTTGRVDGGCRVGSYDAAIRANVGGNWSPWSASVNVGI